MTDNYKVLLIHVAKVLVLQQFSELNFANRYAMTLAIKAHKKKLPVHIMIRCPSGLLKKPLPTNLALNQGV